MKPNTESVRLGLCAPQFQPVDNLYIISLLSVPLPLAGCSLGSHPLRSRRKLLPTTQRNQTRGRKNLTRRPNRCVCRPEGPRLKIMGRIRCAQVVCPQGRKASSPFSPLSLQGPGGINPSRAESHSVFPK